MSKRPSISNLGFDIPGFSTEILDYLFEILGFLFVMLSILKIWVNPITYKGRSIDLVQIYK